MSDVVIRRSSEGGFGPRFMIGWPFLAIRQGLPRYAVRTAATEAAAASTLSFENPSHFHPFLTPSV